MGGGGWEVGGLVGGLLVRRKSSEAMDYPAPGGCGHEFRHREMSQCHELRAAQARYGFIRHEHNWAQAAS